MVPYAPFVPSRPGRQAYIDAAIDRLTSVTLHDIAGLLSFRDIARRVGVTHASVRHQFPDLVELLLEADDEMNRRTVDVGTVERLQRAVEAIGVGAPDAIDRILEAGAHNLATVTADPRTWTVAHLVAAAAGADPRAAAVLGRQYGEVHAGYAGIYQMIADALDLEFRAPFDAESVAAALTALADGISLVVRGRPGVLDGPRFAELALEIWAATTRPAEEPPTPVRLRERALRNDPGVFAERADEGAVIDALLVSYRAHGLPGLDLEQVTTVDPTITALRLSRIGPSRSARASRLWAEVVVRRLGGVDLATVEPVEAAAGLLLSVRADQALARAHVAEETLRPRSTELPEPLATSLRSAILRFSGHDGPIAHPGAMLAMATQLALGAIDAPEDVPPAERVAAGLAGWASGIVS